MNLEPHIESVVYLLRSETSDARGLIRQVASILPFIKNVLNLNLVLTEVGRNTHIFSSVESTSFFVDGITAAANRKKEISNPTIPVEDYFHAMARHATTLPLLPGLAILSGLSLSKPPNEDFIKRGIVRNAQCIAAWAGSGSPAPPDLLVPTLAAACLAKSQWVFDQRGIERIPLNFFWPYLLDLVYPANFDGRLQGPVFADFGAYSQLIAKSLTCLRVLEPFLQRCHQFVCQAVGKYTNNESTGPYKTLLFGVALQLQGMCNQILHNRRLDAGVLCQKTVLILHVLGFVIEETGGKFEAYEFAINICVDVLLESPRAYANQSAIELANWKYKSPFNTVDRGELLFFIDLCERLLPKLENDVLEAYVLPCVGLYIKPVQGAGSSNSGGDGRALLEAAHSFMLEYLSLGNSAHSRNISARKADRNVVVYFDEVVSLYPSILTWDQFKLAISRVTGALSQPFVRPTSIHNYILGRLFELAKTTIPGIPIPESAFPQTGERPPTLRSVYVTALIRALPDLCSQEMFGWWLDQVNAMVPEGYNDLTRRERRYIKSALSDVLTGLNLNLADIGIKYWFEKGAQL